MTVMVPNDSAAGNFTIHLEASGNCVLKSAEMTLKVVAPDFSITAAKSQLTISTTTSDNTALNLASLDGFAGTVSLSAASGYLGYFTVNISPQNVPLTEGGTGTSTITFSASQFAQPGNYTVEVIAGVGGIAHFLALNVTITGATFSLSLDQQFLTVLVGGTKSSTVTVTPSGGYTGPVMLFVSPSDPSGVTGSLSTSQVTLPPAQTLTLTVSAASTTATGPYVLFLTGTDGSVTQTLFISVFVKPNDFDISIDPSLMVLASGGTCSSTITATGVGTFTGTIALTEKNDPSLTVSINPPSVTIPGTPTSTLSISSDPITPPGFYTVQVNGTVGASVRSVTVDIVVIGPDFDLSASPNPVTFGAGSTATATITVNPVLGFAAPVMLSVTTDPSLNASIAPNEVISGGYTATLTLNSTIPGVYFVDVTGRTGAGLSHDVFVEVIVSAVDFAIDPALPTTTTCIVGVQCDTTITITPQNGFSGTVTLTAYPDMGLICNPNPLNPVMGGGGTQMLTCGASVPGTYSVTVIGTSGSLFHSTAQITYQVSPAPDFSLSADAVSPVPLFTGSGSSRITVTSMGGFSGPVTLSLAAPPPQGLSCQTISDWTGSNTPVLACTADAAGDYSVTVVGTAAINSQPVQRSTSVILFHFVDFKIDASPPAGAIYTGDAGTSTITIGALNQFTGMIALSTDHTECNLSTTTVTDSGTSSLSCTFATTGTKTVVITGTIMGLSHSVSITFTVNASPDFTISASSPVSFSSGTTGSSTVSVTPSNGFTGSIDLSYTVSPSSGLTVSFNPTTLSNIYGYGTSRATFSSSIPGTYTVTITGTSGNLKPTTTVTVTVTAIQQVPTAPSTILGLAPAVFYSIIGVVAAIIVAGVAVVFRARVKPKK
jgi:hypothetical protein